MKAATLKFTRVLFPVIGFSIVGYYFSISAGNLPSIVLHDPGFWSFCLAAVLCALVALAWGAIGWHYLIAGGVGNLSFCAAVGIVLASQIGKYLPGNVGHYLGRIAFAKMHGVNVHQGVMSIAIETMMAISSAVILTSLCWIFDPVALEPMTVYLPDMWISLPVLIAFGVVPLFLPWTVGLPWLNRLIPAFLRSSLDVWPSTHATAKVLICQSLSFAFMGLGLFLVVGQFEPASTFTVVYATVVFIAAWTIGTLTPGAPGGLGMREGVLVVGLTPFVAAGDAVVIALAFRVITIAGDGAAYFVGQKLRSIANKSGTANPSGSL